MQSVAVTHRGIWLSTIILIIGVIAGFSLAFLRSPSAAGFTSAYECPATCTGENCPHVRACNSGECSSECPMNCSGNAS